jgi:molybdopterin converting factor small subunit
MSVVRIPSPLRPYTEGKKEVEVNGATVMAVLEDLGIRYPSLRSHLFNGNGALRPYVNIFINDRDIRGLQGEATPVAAADRLMIVPSIAGGSGADRLRPVDHAALRTNQAVIIGLLLAAFIATPALVAIVGAVMLWGSLGPASSASGFYGRSTVYRRTSQRQPSPSLRLAKRYRLVARRIGVALGRPAPLVRQPSCGSGRDQPVRRRMPGALYYWLARFHIPGFNSRRCQAPPGRRQAMSRFRSSMRKASVLRRVGHPWRQAEGM